MTTSTGEFREVRLPAVGIELAACHWHSPDLPPFFALHGWLDNAASMAPLCSALDRWQVLAPDLAGHGRSDFRSTDSNYDLSGDVADLHALAEHLQWQRCGLIGHSRGAMVAALFAATFPEQVSHLVLIDGGAPNAVEPGEHPARLARSVREHRLLSSHRGTLFSSREAALKARAGGYVPVHSDIAELLAERALIEDEEGYRWRADQRLKAASARPFDEQTIRAFFSAIRCPVLQIIASQGLVTQLPAYAGPVELIQDCEVVTLPGDHHLHISQVDKVAAVIGDWLAKCSVRSVRCQP